MTPGIELVKTAGIFYDIHEYQHEASTTSFGVEAAEKMGVDAKRIFKTLLVKTDKNELIVGIIPVLEQLSMKQIAKASASKKAEMADGALVERSTGYVLGGVSPLGQKRLHLTILDKSATIHETIFVSAGRRGVEIELQPKDLLQLTEGKLFDIIQQ